MQFFVQSSGSAPHQDYRWYAVLPTGCTAAEPPRVREWSNLLDNDAPSVLLVHDAARWSLLVTNMPSQRVDFQGRPLRNYLFWHSREVEEEHHLRALAADFLTKGNLLYQQVDQQLIVATDNKAGFYVEHADLEKFSQRHAERQPPYPSAYLGCNNENNRQQLANELRQHQMPNQALVIVTDAKSPEKLERHPFLWRGLSSLESCQQWRKKHYLRTMWQKLFMRQS